MQPILKCTVQYTGKIIRQLTRIDLWDGARTAENAVQRRRILMEAFHEAAVGGESDAVPDSVAVQDAQRRRIDGPAIVLGRMAGILDADVALLGDAVDATLLAHDVRHVGVEAAVSLLQHAQAVHVHGHRHQLTQLEPDIKTQDYRFGHRQKRMMYGTQGG